MFIWISLLDLHGNLEKHNSSIFEAGSPMWYNCVRVCEQRRESPSGLVCGRKAPERCRGCWVLRRRAPTQSCKGRARANTGTKSKSFKMLHHRLSMTVTLEVISNKLAVKGNDIAEQTLHLSIAPYQVSDDRKVVIYISRCRRLGFLLASLLLISLASPAHGQGGFGNFIQNLFRPIMRQTYPKFKIILKSPKTLKRCKKYVS